jgi:hypothetical protein
MASEPGGPLQTAFERELIEMNEALLVALTGSPSTASRAATPITIALMQPLLLAGQVRVPISQTCSPYQIDAASQHDGTHKLLTTRR